LIRPRSPIAVTGRARTDTINRLHQQQLELVPGGAKKFLSAPQARTLPATVRARDNSSHLYPPTAGTGRSTASRSPSSRVAFAA
jgi:hypothetical protein